MRQYVRLFELSMSQYTQEDAYDLTHDTLDSDILRNVFDNKQEHCSQKLGDLIGLEISRKWEMPFGWSEDETYAIFFSTYYAFARTKDETKKDECLRIATEITNEMIRLNPDITTIPNYKRHMPDVIHGMITRFNIEDISFFVKLSEESDRPARHADKNPEYAEMKSKTTMLLRRLFPEWMPEFKHFALIQWVPSMKTLTRIYGQLRNIQNNRTR